MSKRTVFWPGVAAVSLVALGLCGAPAAKAVDLIDENFDNDPDPLGGQPINVCCPGTWLPNNYTTNNVPNWEPMATTTDSVLRLEIFNDAVSGTQAANFAYINRGIGNPAALKVFNLDGFIKTDQVVTNGQVIRATVTIRNIDGEQKFGLSSDIQAMADATASTFGPSPQSAILVEMIYGQGFSSRFLHCLNQNGQIIALAPEPGPVGTWEFPDGSHMADPLVFTFTYTVGAGTIDVKLNHTIDITVRDTAFGHTAGDPVPMRNAAAPTQIDGMFFAGTRGGTDYLIDDILVERVLPTVAFTNIVVEDVAALEFDSELGGIYDLEYAVEPDTNDYIATGATLTGDGGILNMYDPTGFSTQKTYRILLQNP